MPRLRRVDCSGPGIARRRAGRGFAYVDARGRRVRDAETLARIRGLVIPPAWTDVWICPHPNGHIQATGVDARGRRQYRYHDAWRARRDQEKFDHMTEFGRALPRMRERCAEHLATHGFGRERVLACATRLLDLGFFRIGSEGYAEENQSYGLATMRRTHVTVSGSIVSFDYRAKSGKRRLKSVVDDEVARLVRALKARRGGGPELLAYKRGGTWADVKSADINAFIKELSGGEFTAKDFRTWSATVLAAVGLAVSTGAESRTARNRAIVRAVKEVADYLGNTPAVCRASYIDPRVIDAYLGGQTIRSTLGRLGEETAFGELSTQGPIERAVLELLEGASDAEPAAA
ncbi:MAG: DNA topoisomerase IB [Actinobacteria bacterium]|nr:DNA topoisomerase IB [Actinomycetota bacterium]